MRGILVDWLVEVAAEFRLVSDTLFSAVALVDRVLSLRPVPRARLQLVGVACMLLAAKYEEIYAPQVDEFVFITDNTYSRDELLNAEAEALGDLGFSLSAPTAKTFLRRFVKAALGDGVGSPEADAKLPPSQPTSASWRCWNTTLWRSCPPRSRPRASSSRGTCSGAKQPRKARTPRGNSSSSDRSCGPRPWRGPTARGRAAARLAPLFCPRRRFRSSLPWLVLLQPRPLLLFSARRSSRGRSRSSTAPSAGRKTGLYLP